MAEVSAKKVRARTPGATGRGKSPSSATQRAVWARGGGICAHPGCAAALYEDPNYFKSRAFGELAHNVAASADGPRGDATRSAQLSDDPDNLILFCPTHHDLVDKPGWETDYPESLLASWKKQHEAAIRLAGEYSHGTPALPLRFTGVIGKQVMGGGAETIPGALIQRGLIAIERPVDLRVDASGYPVQGPEYWRNVVIEVRRQIQMLQHQGRGHSAIAIFGLADMPALMALGHGLGHAVELHPFQWDRYANSWAFADSTRPAPSFRTSWPTQWQSHVALVLSLSASIGADRVMSALPGDDVSIVEITVDQPDTEIVQSEQAIHAFRICLAGVFARLERELGTDTLIHVFPAMPVSLAVAFGSAVTPKVSLPFSVHDAQGPSGPFHPALSLPIRDL